MDSECTVWWASPPQVKGEDFSRLLHILDPGEQAQCLRKKTSALRDEYLAAHLLQRIHLGRSLGAPPASFRFVRDGHDKPTLVCSEAGPAGWFSLSHTAGCVLSAASTSCPVGLDAEKLDRELDVSSLIDRCLAADEQRYVNAQSSAQKTSCFLRFWTLKEAYLKAVGLGFSVSPASIEFDVDSIESGQPRLLKGVGSDEKYWCFQEFAPTQHHVASVAVRIEGGGVPAIEIRRVDLNDIVTG